MESGKVKSVGRFVFFSVVATILLFIPLYLESISGASGGAGIGFLYFGLAFILLWILPATLAGVRRCDSFFPILFTCITLVGWPFALAWSVLAKPGTFGNAALVYICKGLLMLTFVLAVFWSVVSLI